MRNVILNTTLLLNLDLPQRTRPIKVVRKKLTIQQLFSHPYDAPSWGEKKQFSSLDENGLKLLVSLVCELCWDKQILTQRHKAKTANWRFELPTFGGLEQLPNNRATVLSTIWVCS